MNTLKFHPLIGLMLSILVLYSCTSQEERMKQYQNQAVDKAWAQEQKLVSLGHSGTLEWTKAQKAELLETGKVSGYEGRYVNNNFKEDSPLATDSNNIVFAKVGESSPNDKALKLAPLRSYIMLYEKKKYFLWVGFIVSIFVLIMAIKHKRGLVMYPALVGAFFGTMRLGMISGWSIMATFWGMAGGLIAGTMAGIFLFLVFLSLGVG